MNRKIREKNYKDNNERLFWKVWENDLILNKIFSILSSTPFYGENICDFHFCNRIKFKFIKSCSWMIERNQLALLKCKLKSMESNSIRWGHTDINSILLKCNNYIGGDSNFHFEDFSCTELNDNNSSCCDSDDNSDDDSDDEEFDENDFGDGNYSDHDHDHEEHDHNDHDSDEDSCCGEIQEDDINEERYCNSIDSNWNKELISLIYKRFNEHLKNVDLIHRSVALNNLSALKSFTEDYNIKFNQLSNEESRSMKLAIKNNNIEIIKYLIEKRNVKFPFNKKLLNKINQGKVTNSLLNFIIENPNLTFKNNNNNNNNENNIYKRKKKKSNQPKVKRILNGPFVNFESIEYYSIEVQKKLIELKLVKLRNYFLIIKKIMNYFKRRFEKNKCYKPSQLLIEMVESNFTDELIAKSIKGNPFLLSCFYNRLNDRHFYDNEKNSIKSSFLSFFDELVSTIGKTFEILEKDDKIKNSNSNLIYYNNNNNNNNQILIIPTNPVPITTNLIPTKFSLNYFINNFENLSPIELFNYGEVKKACINFTEYEIITNQGLSEKQISKLIKFYEYDIVLEYLTKLLKSNTIDIGKLVSYAQNADRKDILEYLEDEKKKILNK
ncbi:hypothetical protein ACTA71_008027 [Dictyostelium dimigraforme]